MLIFLIDSLFWGCLRASDDQARTISNFQKLPGLGLNTKVSPETWLVHRIEEFLWNRGVPKEFTCDFGLWNPKLGLRISALVLTLKMNEKSTEVVVCAEVVFHKIITSLQFLSQNRVNPLSSHWFHRHSSLFPYQFFLFVFARTN